MAANPQANDRPHFAHLAPRLLASQEDRPDNEEQPFEAEMLLQDAVAARASDIHLDPGLGGLRLRFRVDGAMVDVCELGDDLALRLTNQLKNLAQLNPMPVQTPESGRFTWQMDDQGLDLRLTVAPCLRGDKLAVRILSGGLEYTELEDLGLNDDQGELLSDWLESSSGMLLVTGPTGAGKTTTLYALLHRLRTVERNVITLEDPVEYEIDGINQMPVNEAQGFTFASGTRTVLRLDPDCILLGEIRDSDSARAANDIASSGRTLMATLHSRDAVGAITMLRNYGMDDFEIAANLEVVVSQRLVRALCPHCKEERVPNERERRYLQQVDYESVDRIWSSTGCPECNDIGYRGRTGLFEVWRLGAEAQALLLEHTSERVIRKHLNELAHDFLLNQGLLKVTAGITTLGELWRAGLGSRGRHDSKSSSV
ncbi:general secretion pathway protein E [Natronocella acetinitrilica]|uniref:General secretion pathway protein E n=1 Tax=Natronocella acetinitrilica TaxID=414046 RepID=A0AAE3KA16_9GAMM|nr:GspE/PulE family protein [Natronocella acetinitrilica]MCP1672934.1 general secretion pathway protein E [Natronocella acetinitrilica]